MLSVASSLPISVDDDCSITCLDDPKKLKIVCGFFFGEADAILNINDGSYSWKRF